MARSRSIGREDSLVDEFLAVGDAVVKVDAQRGDGRPAGRRAADQVSTVPSEMPVPLVATRVEQRNDLFVFGSMPARLGPLNELQKRQSLCH
jgi:hypothetical protein